MTESKLRAALVRLLWNSISDKAECTCFVGDACPECQAMDALGIGRWLGAEHAAEALGKLGVSSDPAEVPADGPPRTAGEVMAWTAAYGAARDRMREFKRKHGHVRDDHAIAEDACDEAWGALHELREIAAGDGDFADDAKAVIGWRS